MKSYDRAPDERSSLPQRALSADTSHVAAPKNDASARFQVGDFEVRVVSDGYISVPREIFAPDVTPETRAEALERLDVQGDTVRTPTNIPVLRSKSDLILFDIGAGSGYQSSDGKLTQNLKAIGVGEDEVTKIVFTHAHPDHIAATLTDDGSLRFPNATYFVGAREWDFWMDPDFFTKNPDPLHVFGRDAQRDLSAIGDRVVMLQPGDDVVTGIRTLATPGHTPGHLSFEVAGPDGMIIAVDAATSEIVAFEHPDWTFGYDTIPDVAIESRRRLLDQAAADRTKLLGFHWTYPGVGFVEAIGLSYRFIPA